MKRQATHILALMVTAGFVLGGCSSSDANAPTTEPDAAVDAPEDTFVDVDANAKLCASACECTRVKDKPRCETHCQQELEGKGYLHQDMAIDFYHWLDEQPEKCNVDINSWSLRWDPLSKGGMDRLRTLDEEQFKPCFDWAPKANFTSKAAKWSYCFENYYVYNEPIRAKLRECYALPELKKSYDCIDNTADCISDGKWLQGFGPEWDDSCPAP